MIRIECIKGFRMDGGSLAIMQGEVFELSEDLDMADERIFVGVPGASQFPEMEIWFNEDQLCDNFKLIANI